MPLEAHIKEHPAWFHRFDALWTPTVLIMDAEGRERERIEGYLPKTDFRARLEMGLARVAFTHKRWAEAEERYTAVAQNYPDTTSAPEALYWRGVSHYKATNDHTVLGEVAEEFKQKYTNSEWAKKVLPWSH